jgi:hypothetical protein
MLAVKSIETSLDAADMNVRATFAVMIVASKEA